LRAGQGNAVRFNVDPVDSSYGLGQPPEFSPNRGGREEVPLAFGMEPHPPIRRHQGKRLNQVRPLVTHDRPQAFPVG